MSAPHDEDDGAGRQGSPVPGVVGLARPRLLDRLDRAHLALVVAPQGSGKTTLLAHAARRAPTDVVWVRCEAGDPGSPDGPRLTLRTSPRLAGRLAQGDGPGRLSRLSHAAQDPLLVVVDDAHHLIGSSLEDELTALLAHAPPHVSVLIGSRRAPPLNLARVELSAPVTLTDVALRFRSWEVERLYRELYGVPLAPEDVAALTWHTDGWAAALHLFQLSVADDLPGEQRRAIRRLDHRQRFAWDYLHTQVLRPLPVDLQRFLHSTSTLDLLTPRRCDALLGVSTSRDTLQRLDRATSLVRAVGEDGYRVHRVLRRHLLAAASDELSVAQARSTHARTAEVLEAEGALHEALRSRGRAHDLAGVERLLTRVDPGAHDRGEREWGSAFPADLVEADAGVLLARARELVADGRVAQAEVVVRHAEARADTDAERLAAARRVLDALNGTADRVYTLMDPKGPRRPDWFHLVIAATVRDPGAVVALAPATARGRALVEGVARLLGGDQVRAREALRDAANDVEADASMMLLAQLFTAVFARVQEDAGIATVLDRIHSEAERRGLVWLARITHGVVLAFDDDPAARDQVARCVAYCERDGDRWSALLVAGAEVVARARRGAGDPEDWERFAQRCHALGAGTLVAWAHGALAVAAVRAGLPDAADLAAQAESLARSADVPGALALAYVALAGCKPAQRDDLLRLASSTARSVGLDDPTLPAPPDPVAVPAPAVLPPHAAEDDAEETRPTALQVGERERLVVVRCFGAYDISVDGRGVDLSGLRPRARRTLRYLSMRAGRPVHREQLARALWGELDLRSAMHNLHVNVSAVRRALEPRGAPRDEGLVRRDGETYMLPLPPGSDCDVARFEQRLSRARRLEHEHPSSAVSGWQAAVDAYGGELLPEEGAADWVRPERERYVLLAAGAAESLAGACLRAGEPDRAVSAARHSIELNRWVDAPWRLLVEALTALGDHAAALHARREYDAVLQELGVHEPVSRDPGTRPRRSPPTSLGSHGTTTRS